MKIAIPARHAGKTDRQRAIAYLRWLIAQADISPSRRRLAQAELQQLQVTRG